MSDPDQTWQRFLLGVRNGDDDACREFYEHYAPLIERLASNKMGDALKKRVGADDVLQSACRTFFRRAGQGEFDLPDAEALWRLLCTITLNKIRAHGRAHSTGKRDLSKERSLDAQAGDGPRFEVAGEFANLEEVEFADELAKVVALLTEEEQTVLELRLQEFTQPEIAERIKRSERSVRRILTRMQDKLGEMFDSD